MIPIYEVYYEYQDSINDEIQEEVLEGFLNVTANNAELAISKVKSIVSKPETLKNEESGKTEVHKEANIKIINVRHVMDVDY